MYQLERDYEYMHGETPQYYTPAPTNSPTPTPTPTPANPPAQAPSRGLPKAEVSIKDVIDANLAAMNNEDLPADDNIVYPTSGNSSGIIILVVIGVVGAAAYFVWRQRNG